ncbi:MAG: OmpA family protein [Bacteroidales bacterium]|nr:OmpA family protein [Candidatus Cacconaster merdequi]
MLERLGQRAKQTVENKIGEKVENAISNSIDKVTSPQKESDTAQETQEVKASASNADPAMQSAPAQGTWTCPECGKAGNTGDFCVDCGAKRPESYTGTNAVQVQKSDFVPGDIVMFEDKVSGEQVGEFPSKWDLERGNAEIAVINGQQAIAMDQSDSWISPLIIDPVTGDVSKNYLGDYFTIEFDMMYDDRPKDGAPNIEFDIMAPTESRDNEIYTFTWYFAYDNQDINCNYVKSGSANNTDKQGLATKEGIGPINDGQWHHFAVSFNQRALKFYVDGVRVINVPAAKAGAGWFTIFSKGGLRPTYLKNVRVAKGGGELYGRNATDISAAEKAIRETGKFVTNNILFDTGKATLKPESMTDIQMVADYMKKNPSARFEVQGHCDNTGSAATNDKLSQQRAEAIVAELVKLGCDEFHLRAVGKGSHEPVADNSTEEGRAKNRRVEFIKK